MEEKEIHLRDYLRVIVKRKFTVLTVFVVVFAAVLIGTFSATPVYQASAKILIEKSEPSNIPTSNYYYFPYDPEFNETQYQLIKSSSVAERVVKMLSLDETYESYFREDEGKINIIGGTIKWFRELANVLLHVAGRTEEESSAAASENAGAGDRSTARELAKMISGSLSVTPVKDSKVITVSYLSTNPELAAMIVNSVVQAYKDEILEMKMSSASYAIEWLKKKADEERVKLELTEKELQDYMRRNDIVTLENRIAMVPERLSEIGSRIAEAETKRKEMESLYNRVRDISEDLESAEAIPAIGSDPTIQSLREQILTAEQNIMDISKKYGQKHPAMISAINDLKGLREKKKQEIGRVIDTIKNDYELAKANEENFRKLAVRAKGEILNLREKFIQYEALKRENETNKQLFDAIMKRIKEQGVTQDIQTVDAWLVEKAEVPHYPAKPNKMMNILLGLIVGLFGGVGLAFFVEYLDNTVKSPDDVEERFTTPVLGTIELYSGDKRIEQVVLEDPHAIIVEQYKTLRTAILLSTPERPPGKLLVTSVEPDEGKTVTSVNLAMTIAQSENSVLLIDTDLRKSVIHRILGLDNEKGLSTFLAGTSGDDIVLEGPVKNLSVIPAGPNPPNPSELLGSSRMDELLERMGKKFDIIVMDSSPLFAVSDSLVLSNKVDSTLLVTRSGKTTYDGLRRGLKMLDDVKSQVLGIVINSIDVKKGGYYFYERYYHYSYSSSDKEGA